MAAERVATRKAQAALPAFPWGSLIRRQGLYQSVCAHRRVPAVGATAFPRTSRERKRADSSTRNPKGTPSEGQPVPVSRAHWQAQPGGRSDASVQGAAATMAAATVRRNGTGCPERSSYHTDTRTPAPRNGIGTLTARSFRYPYATQSPPDTPTGYH